MKLNITGYSTALFSTWYFIEELGLLFDAGDGVTSGLLQKSKKVKHAFISHADRDHLGGLLQFNQLNGFGDAATIYYPRDCGSFPFLNQFAQKFDPHVAGVHWKSMNEDEPIYLKNDLMVLPFRNHHIPAPPDKVKSLSFHVFKVKRKLKPEFLKLSGLEIKELRETKGEDFVTTEVRENILSYSGDTPVEWDGRFKDSKILIHEATFLGDDPSIVDKDRMNKHSFLTDVIKMVADSNIEKLILGHFSSRYSDQEIDRAIQAQCLNYGLKIPVYRLLPGRIYRDILGSKPLNSNSPPAPLFPREG